MNQTDLKHKLSAPFDFNEWKNILAQMFPKIDYLAKETSVDNNLVKNGGQIGVIHLNDGRSLGLFKFEVADNIHISRNRKGLREIAAKYVDQDIINGALVLYYSGIQTEYRLTFVSKQTVFDSEGNLSIKETAPKRYTFLLGESEPCTTAANRLIELINKNKRGSVYLDDVTEAFSVERLNKDFFNGYKTQYKRFVDTLTKAVKGSDRTYTCKLNSYGYVTEVTEDNDEKDGAIYYTLEYDKNGYLQRIEQRYSYNESRKRVSECTWRDGNLIESKLTDYYEDGTDITTVKYSYSKTTTPINIDLFYIDGGYIDVLEPLDLLGFYGRQSAKLPNKADITYSGESESESDDFGVYTLNGDGTVARIDCGSVSYELIY